MTVVREQDAALCGGPSQKHGVGTAPKAHVLHALQFERGVKPSQCSHDAPVEILVTG